MALVETVDNLIRVTLRAEVQAEAPSAAVREALLAAAAADNPLRSVLGPTVPPLVEELLDKEEASGDWGAQVVTAIPIMRKQLLLLVGQWDVVVR